MIVASLITGLLVSLYFQDVGLVFLLCFTVGSIASTVFVNFRGMFLTVASIPVLFAVGLLASSWAVAQAQSSGSAPLLSRATALTTVYPLTQHFPWLAAVTVIAVLIAVLRHQLMRRRVKDAEREAEEMRVRNAEADRRNRTLSQSARRRISRTDPVTGQITVEELLARNKRNPPKED